MTHGPTDVAVLAETAARRATNATTMVAVGGGFVATGARAAVGVARW